MRIEKIVELIDWLKMFFEGIVLYVFVVEISILSNLLEKIKPARSAPMMWLANIIVPSFADLKRAPPTLPITNIGPLVVARIIIFFASAAVMMLDVFSSPIIFAPTG